MSEPHEWTPEHDAICHALANGNYRDPHDVRNMDIATVLLESDWLNSLKADLRADAWDEGANHASTSKCKFARDGDPCPGNPYRKVASE